MENSLFFFIVDFIYPPPFKDRTTIEFTSNLEEENKFPCGYTMVNYGHGERNLVIFTFSESEKVALKNLTHFAKQHRLTIIPMDFDWTKINALIHSLRGASKFRFNLISILDEIQIDESTIKSLKDQLCRKITQNEKWNRKFAKLLNRIKEYQQKPNQELEMKILKECFFLNILP